MNRELEQAIKERIDLGYSQDRIAEELRAAGYDEDTIAQVYEAVVNGSSLPDIPTATPGKLIGPWELVTQAFSLLVEQWRLFLTASLYGLGALALMAAVVGAGVFATSTLPVGGVVFAGLAGLITVVMLIVVAFSLQRALLLRGQELPFRDHITYCFRNIVGIIVVGIFVQFVTSLGQLLFVLPGIAFAIYLAYAIMIRLEDRGRMTMALVQSAQLVYGRWWGVLGRLIVLFLVIIACAIPFVGLVFIVGGASVVNMLGTEAPSFEQFGILTALFALFLIATGLFISLVSQCAMVRLYESLKETAITYSEESTKKLRTWMIVGIVLGVPAAIFLSALDASNEFGDADDPFGDLLLPADQINVTPEQQAEFDAFFEEFGGEFDSM